MIKLVLWVVGVMVLIGVGGWVWFSGALNPLLTEVGLEEQTDSSDNTETPQSAPQSELTTGSDTSDEALDEDLDTLDAQMSAYGEASAAVDQSLTDQPVQQEY